MRGGECANSKIDYGVAAISRLLKIIGLFAEYSLFYRALLQKRRIILSSLLIIHSLQSANYFTHYTTQLEHSYSQLQIG